MKDISSFLMNALFACLLATAAGCSPEPAGESPVEAIAAEPVAAEPVAVTAIGILLEPDATMLAHAAGEVFARANVTGMKLEAFKYYYTPAGGDLGLAGICATPTPEILQLQADIIAAVKPFEVETAAIDAFTASHGDPATDAVLIDYVSTFVPKMTGDT